MAYEDRPVSGGVTSSTRKAHDRQELPEHPIAGDVDPLSDNGPGTLTHIRSDGPREDLPSGGPEAAEPDSTLDSAIHTLIAAVRQECARERKRERDNLMHLFQQRVHQLEIEANRKVRDKLTRARERDREKLEERSRRLDNMFAQLNRLAREVAEQKQVLRNSRDELEAKLLESDLIQSELRDIGQNIGEQIETFGDSLPDDSFIDQFELKRQVGG